MKYAQTHEQRHEFWQDQIAKWKISGKTKEVFCEEQGLGYYSFLRWSSRLNEESAKGSTFVEVGGTQQSGIEATAKVEIDQPVDIAVAGATIRVNRWIGEEALSRIIRAVEHRRC